MKRPFLKLSIELLVFIALLAVSGLLLRPASLFLSGILEDARDDFAERLESGSGLRILYASLSPSILNSLVFTDLEVVSVETGATVAAFKTVEVRYNLFLLLRGRTDSAFSGLAVRNGYVDIDQDRDATLIDRLRILVQTDADSSTMSFIPDTTEVQVRNLDLRYRDAGAVAAVHIKRGQAFVTPDSFDFSFISEVTAALTVQGNTYPLSSMLNLDGSLDRSFSGGTAALILTQIDAGLFKVNRFSLFASLAGDELTLSSVQDLQPIDIRMLVNLKERSIRAELECERLLPLRWVRLERNLGDFSFLQESVLTGGASIEWVSGGSLYYEVDLSAEIPERTRSRPGILSARFSGDDSEINFDSIAIQTFRHALSWTGSLDLKTGLPDGYLEVPHWRLPSDVVLTFEAFVMRQNHNRGVECLIPVLEIGSTQWQSISVQVLPDQENIDFNLSALLTMTETQDLPGRVSLEGSFFRGDRPFIQSYLAFDSVNLNSLFTSVLSIFPRSLFANSQDGTVPDLLSSYALTTELYFSTDFSSLSWNCTRLVVAAPEIEGVYILLSAKGTDRDLNLTDLTLAAPGINATGNINALFSSLDDILVDVSFIINEIPYTGTAIYNTDLLSLYGDYGLSASVLFSSDGQITAIFGMNSLPLSFGTQTLGLSLNGSMSWNSPDNWGVAIRDGLLEDAAGRLLTNPRLTFMGSLDQNGLFLDQVVFADSISTISGYGGFTRSLLGSQSVRYQGEVNLSDGRNQEVYNLEFGVSLDDVLFLDAQGTVQNSPLRRFDSTQGNEHLISAGFSVSGTPEEMLLAADLQHILIRIAGFNLDARGKLHLEDGEIRIDQAGGTWNSHTVTDVAGAFTPENGNGNLQGTYYGVLGTAGLTSGIDITLESGSNLSSKMSFSDPAAELNKLLDLFAVFSLKARFFNPTWNGVVLMDGVTCTFVREPGITAFYAGENDSFSGFLLDDGTFAMQAERSLPVAFTADGLVRDALLDITVADLNIKIPGLWPFFGIKEVVFDEGIVEGSLHISGLLNDPEFAGQFNAAGIIVRAPDLLGETYGPVSFTAVASGKTLTVEPFMIQARQGQLRADAFFEFDRWLPAQIDVNARTLDRYPLKVLAKTPVFNAKGFADVDMKLVYTPGFVDITGSVLFEKGSFAVLFTEIGQMQSFRDVLPVDIRAALDIRIGNKVEFRWPNDELPIIRGLVQSGTPLTITVDTSRDLFSLRGQTSLRGGEIFYIKRSFYLRNGQIDFNENQSRFDPLVSLFAEIRERDEDGRPVRIYMQVENQPLSVFVPVLRSDPVKSDAEIMALLGQDLQELFSRESAAQAAIVVASDILTQMGIFRNVENSIRDVLNLDIFSIRTLILQNALIGTVQQQESGTRMTLGNYFDNTTVYLGKYFGSAIYAEALLHFSYFDDLSPQNSGRVPGAYGNLLFQPELGLEMTTPFFLLRWGISPRHPETLFVSDNSVSLSWKFAY